MESELKSLHKSLRSQALADSLWQTVKDSEQVDTDLVFRDLFVRSGKALVEKGDRINGLLGEIYK